MKYTHMNIFKIEGFICVYFSLDQMNDGIIVIYHRDNSIQVFHIRLILENPNH